MADVIFLTGYSNDNLQTSKERGILGWKQNSKRKELSKGDYVFVYNVDNKKIDYLFQITSRITSTDLIWKDEIQSNTIKYENRWHVSLIKDNLNIHINEILNLYPFNQDPNRFYLLIKNPFPNFLDERYNDFKSYILKKTKLNEVFIVNEKIEIDPNQTHPIQEGSGSSPMNENYLILRKQKPLDFTKPEFYAGPENLNRNKIIKGSNVIIEGPYKGKNTLLGYGRVISTYKSSTFSSVPFGSTTVPIQNFKKFISLESSLETPGKIKNLLAQIPEYKNPYNSVIEITQEQFHQIVNEYENPNLTFTKNKIETYSEKNDNIQYFLVQVNEAGSENIL